ncbi:histidinol dehydrogenase [Silvibacterium dinghuense]|uniref:Histidinol dehydrogenase n=2 Tax=Silvibacterium dinghuense TaxID=1560006 RepID=A0A4Q1SKC3_9BACT|nr:histidinol dehydrogenase [Silvibacterium dinghuense]RXS97909.1 histidinol dehydrogenase [Silvibacterium dinghuense]GGH02924.1 histidinol dehydrogenase [Silvibacterium dinghuense]
MKVMTTRSAAAKRRIGELLTRRSDTWERVTPAAKRIVDGVRKGGDRVLRRYASQLDKLPSQSPLQISADELKAAWEATPVEMRRTLETAAKNIRAFAQKQKPKDWDFAPVPGVTTGQRVRPLGAVGCYVPSGRYPLPSTLLMTAIPAQVAGVPRIVAVSPKPALETLAAAHLLGITEFYRLGGAHAIAALAYGTETLAKVDKIVGPGNAYVTAAKKLVSFDCAIDMLAGPTEIVVTSDAGTPAGIASDLVAQAEHDPDALAIFLTTRADLASVVSAEVKQRVKSNATAREAIQRNGLIFVTKSQEEARDLTNALAPEHLTIDSEEDLAWVENAGSVFIGEHSAQPLGDYVSGPNHTLPTGGLARVRGGLSVMDFVKLITVQSYTAKGLAKLGPAGVSLAKAEGLTGHADAIEVRLKALAEGKNA